MTILWKQANHDSKTKDDPKHKYTLAPQQTNTCINIGLLNEQRHEMISYIYGVLPVQHHADVQVTLSETKAIFG